VFEQVESLSAGIRTTSRNGQLVRLTALTSPPCRSLPTRRDSVCLYTESGQRLGCRLLSAKQTIYFYASQDTHRDLLLHDHTT